MRNYETVFIMDPALGDEKAAAEIDRAKSIIESAKGEVLDVQKWGKRKLAYEIKKRREGIYALIRFKGDGAVVSDLERGFRLSEPVIRFMTVADTSPQTPEEGGEEPSAGAAREGKGTAATGLAAGEEGAAGALAGGGESAEAAAVGEERSPAGAPDDGGSRALDGAPGEGLTHAGGDAPAPSELPSGGGAPEPEDKGPAAAD